MPWLKCFLCRRKDSKMDGHKLIYQTTCSSSNKTLKEILEYLSTFSGAIIQISKTDLVCFKCYLELREYDDLMLKTRWKQKRLSRMVEDTANGVDSDYEKECNAQMEALRELEESHFFDNNEEVSDGEIESAIREALGKNDVKKSKLRALEKMKEELKKYSCSYCYEKFKAKNSLYNHIYAVHQKHACEQCNFTHRNEEYVKLHMNTHEGKDPNQCRYCDKVFSSKISTIRHMEVHLDSKKYQCDKCGLCFSQTTVLYNHKLQHEAEENPLECEICHQMFKTKRTYRNHMNTHKPDRQRFSCEYCQKTFTEKYTLKVHIKRAHAEAAPSDENATSSNVIANNETMYNASNTSIAMDHPMETNSNEIITPIDVPVNLPPLEAGVLTLPAPDNNRYNCIICEQVFYQRDLLNKHMEKDHDVIVNPLAVSNYTQYDVITNVESKRSCHICGTMFSTQSNLDIHMEQYHAM